MWADRKDRNEALDGWLAGQDRLQVEGKGKPDSVKGFIPLQKRWVV